MNRQSIVPLSLGLVSGVLSAISLLQYQGLSSNPSIAPDPDYAVGGTSFYLVSLLKKQDEEKMRPDDGEGVRLEDSSKDDGIEKWLNDAEDMGRKKREDVLLKDNEEFKEDGMGLDKELMEVISSTDFDTYKDAQRLKDKLKVLCMVAVAETDKETLDMYITALETTWSKHCTKVMVVTNTPINIPGNVVRVDLKPGSSRSWLRTKVLLIEAHDRFVDEFDWFIKVSYDGYMVLENLRYLLLVHQNHIPGYIGHVFKGPTGGGSALALSRFAMELIRPSLATWEPRLFQGYDDADALESCFRSLEVISLMDGHDQSGSFRHQMRVAMLDLPCGATSRMQWNWKYNLHPKRQDDGCCQEYPVSFHNVESKEMYILEYTIYHLRPFGIGNYSCPSMLAVR